MNNQSDLFNGETLGYSSLCPLVLWSLTHSGIWEEVMIV